MSSPTEGALELHTLHLIPSLRQVVFQGDRLPFQCSASYLGNGTRIRWYHNRAPVEGDEQAVVPKGSAEPEFRWTLPEKLAAPVRAGEKVGTLRVMLGDETLAQLPVLAAEDVPRIGFWGVLVKLAGNLVGLS